MKPTYALDVECYPNFFLILFKEVNTGQVIRCQISPNRTLNRPLLLQTLNSSLVIGFNSIDYDLPMVQLALKGYSTAELKDASDDIIVTGMRHKEFAEKHQIGRPSWDHIDIIQVAPGKASLKLYAGRQHCRKLQDLPLDPDKELTAADAALIAEYCENDLDNTITTYRELEAQINLREELSKEYSQDLRSKSDAQVAEHILCAEIKKLNGVWPKRPTGLEGTEFSYKIPEYVVYTHPELQSTLELVRAAKFTVSDTGKIALPPEIANKVIRIGGAKYRIGIGGLHSSETKVAYVADADTLLIDRDVASYYPYIILTQRLFPQHLGEAFLKVYQGIVDRRIAAKRLADAAGKAAGFMKKGVPIDQWEKVNVSLIQDICDSLDKLVECGAINKIVAESLKIAVNGSFGKLGSKWSALYAPDLMIQVTVSGQLLLLMLIDRVEAAGIPVISANTDGIVMKCPKDKYAELEAIVKEWEGLTGLTTEETRYRAIYSKDVNNYIAIKEDGKTKLKGLYANHWEADSQKGLKLQKNPMTTIVIDAVVELLRDGRAIDDTLYACDDIRKFVSIRTVNGGAKQDDVYLGKVVRWYYARGSQNIMNYQKTGNKVPKTDGSKPLMMLPDKFPTDVNYDWYANEARDVLRNIGFGQPSLFQ